MASVVTFTLSVYDTAGTSVAFAVSSIVGDTLPYLKDVPYGDGQEYDPLTGETRAGQYTGRIVDAITSGTDRVVTSRLEDSGYRQQLMRRKAILKMTVDGTDVVLCAGLLTRLTLAGLAEYEYEVTDRTRIKSDRKIFVPRTGRVVLTAGASAGATSLSCSALTIGLCKNTILNFGSGKIAVVSANAAAGATSFSVVAIALAVVSGDQAGYRESIADFLVRWPYRGCAFGGPIIGGFLDQPDRGGWLMQMHRRDSVAYQLKFLQGYGPPYFGSLRTSVSDPELGPATNAVVGPYSPRGSVDPFGNAALLTSAVITFDQAERSGFARDLVLDVLSETGGTRYGFYQPFIFGRTTEDPNPSLVNFGRAAKGSSPANEPGIALAIFGATDYGASGLPAVNTRVRVRAFTASVSEVSPIYLDLHPVDLMTRILTELGYSYDAASATTVTNTIGADLRWQDRVTSPQTASSYLTMLQAAFGIGLRMQADGDLEFFAARVFSNSPPATTITDADVVTPEEGGAGPIFEISEQTAIAKVVVEMTSLTAATGDDAEPRPDGITARPYRIERINGDPGAVGDRTHTLTLSGQVGRANGSYKPFIEYFDVPIREIFDRYGRGVIECGVPLLRGGSGDALNVGDECIVRLSQLPNRNKRYGDDNTVGGRAMQIVRLTRTMWGALAKLVDSGPNAQPYATAPTISIAKDADYPETIAKLTITNAATLNAAGAGARVRMATTTGAAPASTDYADALLFPPGQVPTTAFALPTVLAGMKVYATARAETAADRPSNYATAVSVTLDSYTAPSAVTVTADGADGTKASVTWTVGESALQTDIFYRLTSGTTASDDIAIESLQPGTTSYALRNLKPGTGYTISVRHRDPITGDTSSKATGTVTTDADVSALSAPDGVRGFVGTQDGAFGVPTDAATFGIAGRATETPIDLEAYFATETSVGAGTFGDYVFLGRGAGRQGTWTPIASRAPKDGLRRNIKMRQLPQGRHPGIASMLPGEVAALTLAEAAAMDAYGLAGLFSDVVTVTPYTNAAIQKTYKTMRLSAPQFQVGTNAAFYDSTGDIACPAAGTGTARAQLFLPHGVTVDGYTVRGRNSGGFGETVQVTLYRVSDGTVTSLSSVSLIASPYGETSGSLGLVIDNDTYTYYASVSITTGVATQVTRFSWVSFDYSSPALDVSI